jgi:hypothetical protein
MIAISDQLSSWPFFTLALCVFAPLRKISFATIISRQGAKEQRP